MPRLPRTGTRPYVTRYFSNDPCPVLLPGLQATRIMPSHGEVQDQRCSLRAENQHEVRFLNENGGWEPWRRTHGSGCLTLTSTPLSPGSGSRCRAAMDARRSPPCRYKSIIEHSIRVPSPLALACCGHQHRNNRGFSDSVRLKTWRISPRLRSKARRVLTRATST